MAGERRCDGPPILTLLDAIDSHRGAFEIEWRSRFGMALDVPAAMGWGEAWRIFELLARDPSTWVAAEMAGWQYPASRDALAIADLVDLTGKAHWGRKWGKNYPRPWDERPKRIGTGRRTVADWHRFKERKLSEHRRRRNG